MRLYPFSLLILLAAAGCVLEPTVQDGNVPAQDPDGVNNPFEPAPADASPGNTADPASSAGDPGSSAGNDPFDPTAGNGMDTGFEDEDEDEDEDEEDDD